MSLRGSKTALSYCKFLFPSICPQSGMQPLRIGECLSSTWRGCYSKPGVTASSPLNPCKKGLRHCATLLFCVFELSTAVLLKVFVLAGTFGVLVLFRCTLELDSENNTIRVKLLMKVRYTLHLRYSSEKLNLWFIPCLPLQPLLPVMCFLWGARSRRRNDFRRVRIVEESNGQVRPVLLPP